MRVNTELKNKVLKDLAHLISLCSAEIIAANQQDLTRAQGVDATLLDRLKVDEKKVKGMISAVEEVLTLPDPEGKILHQYLHPNGMQVENRSVPFGRILIIYESRPDVTIEAAVNAFKSGNVLYLKGGKEARNTNLYLVSLWAEALKMNNLPENWVNYLDIDRAETQKLLRENTLRLDLIIPRGGEALIQYIQENTNVPLMISGRGNNFVYVHEDADFEMAERLILNGKSRLSVCNAIDKVLFHQNIPDLAQKITLLLQKSYEMNLDVYGDGAFFQQFEGVGEMQEQSMYEEEFLSPKILWALVPNLETAIERINQYSGGHSAVIVTKDKAIAEQFQYEVDCAAVYHNASSRFTDGGQFGFGAEIAISTQKLHFRGPLGLAELVTNKWFIQGDGQTRN